MRRKPSTSRTRTTLTRVTYDQLEPRNLLAGDILVGNLNSGVAVSDNATGTGHIMYSEVDVHTRFSGVPSTNADHFIATRLDGLQWQYNNDASWINFTPVESDLLVAEVNYSSDTVSRLELSLAFQPTFYEGTYATIVETVLSGISEGDLRFAANRYDGSVDVGEFQVLGSSFSRLDYDTVAPESLINLSQLRHAAHRYETATGELFRAASLDDAGNPMLSWRVQLLPFLGLQNLYDQFNLDEPWDSANNLPLASQMPDIYSSPHFSSPNETSFVLLTGTGTLFPFFGSGIDPFDDNDIPDGAHTTIMLVEADADRAVVWSQPGDIEFDPANPLDGLGNITPAGFSAMTAYGVPMTIPATVDPDNFTNMVLRDDGNFVDFTNVETFHYSGNSLSQIIRGTFEHANRFNTFPEHAIYSADGTTPLLSWRVAILPYIQHQDLYDQFHLDEPWDSPHNITLLPKMPLFYSHPDVANGLTSYLAVVGSETAFPLDNVATDWTSIHDGTRNTVMFVEADADYAVEWTRPADWFSGSAATLDGLGDLSPDNGFYVSFANGAHRFVSNDIDGANFAKMLSIDGGEVADFSDMSPVYRAESQLQDLGWATLNYESAHMRLPQHATYDSDSTPLLSWRVQILPFLEQKPLYDMFRHDQPWDSAHNLALLPLMPDVFASEGLAEGFTVFQASSGPTTVFPFADESSTINSITDGQVNTALYVQTNSDRAVEWTRPADLAFDSADPGDGLGDAEASGFHFVSVEGKTHFYNNALDREPLEFLLQKNDDEVFTAEHDEDVSQRLWDQQIEHNLRELSLAALNFESATMRFPSHAIYSPPTSSGTPTLSWRVQLLPFLDQQPLYDMFHLDEPWDSPHNLSLLPLMPDVFAHPLVEPGKTVFLAVTTPNNSSDSTLVPIHYRGYQFGNISDGSSNTALYVEANIDQAVEWTKPEDILFDLNDPKFGLGDAFLQIGNHVALADGSVHFFRDCASPDFMASLLRISDGNIIDTENYNCDSGPATIASAGLSYAGVEAFDKKPLLPGETATFENYSSYVHGITSVSVDIGRLANPNDLSADDFIFRIGNGNELSDFATIAITPTVTVDTSGGDNESARVTLEFPSGAITNTWLQVTVRSTANTGLDAPNVFYFGSAIGETGNSANDAIVNLVDVALARGNQSGFGTVPADNPYDIDRNGRVNLVDVALIRVNQSGFGALNLITAPGSSSRSAVTDSKTSDTAIAPLPFTPLASDVQKQSHGLAIDSNQERTKHEKTKRRSSLAHETTLKGSVQQLVESEVQVNRPFEIFNEDVVFALDFDIDDLLTV